MNFSLTATTEKESQAIRNTAGGDLYALEPETRFSADHDVVTQGEAEREAGITRGL